MGHRYQSLESPLPEYSLKKQSEKPLCSWHVEDLTALTATKLRQQTISTRSAFSVLPILLLFSLCSVSTATTCSSSSSLMLFTASCNCALSHLIFLFSHLAPLSVLINTLYQLSSSPLGTEVDVNTRPQSSAL